MPSDDIPVSRPSFCTPRSSKHIIRSEEEGFLKFKQRNYPEFFCALGNSSHRTLLASLCALLLVFSEGLRSSNTRGKRFPLRHSLPGKTLITILPFSGITSARTGSHHGAG